MKIYYLTSFHIYFFIYREDTLVLNLDRRYKYLIYFKLILFIISFSFVYLLILQDTNFDLKNLKFIVKKDELKNMFNIF